MGRAGNRSRTSPPLFSLITSSSTVRRYPKKGTGTGFSPGVTCSMVHLHAAEPSGTDTIRNFVMLANVDAANRVPRCPLGN